MKIFSADLNTSIKSKIKLYNSRVSAGFPSPADEHSDETLNLHEHLVEHPAATFFVKVQGDSMEGIGIYSGDLLVVDRSPTPRNHDIVVAIINGEFTVKRFLKENRQVTLFAENPNYPPITIEPEMDFEIWGKVIHCVRSF